MKLIAEVLPVQCFCDFTLQTEGPKICQNQKPVVSFIKKQVRKK